MTGIIFHLLTMILKKMKGFDTLPLAYLKTILSISGIWPILTPSQRYIRALLISANFTIAYFLQASYFLSSEFDIKSSVIYMAYLSTTITMALVYYSSLFKKKYIYSSLTKLLDDWVNIKNTKEYDVLIEYGNYARKCSSILIVSYIFYSTFLSLQSLKSPFLDIVIPLNKTRPRNLMYTMSAHNEEDKYFLMLLLFQYSIFLVLGLSIISGISTIVTILLHICAMFKIIGCLLDNILEGKIKGLKIIDNKVIYNKIIHIIQIHDRSFQYIDAYNSNTNVITLIILTCALCFIGTATIHIMDTFAKIKNEDIVNILILPIIYTIFHLIWLFMLCFIGQHLKNVSESVFYKANETSWYLLSKQSKILLYFIIARASKQTYISIGNMFAATHEFFVQLVKLSVSYAIVIHSKN